MPIAGSDTLKAGRPAEQGAAACRGDATDTEYLKTQLGPQRKYLPACSLWSREAELIIIAPTEGKLKCTPMFQQGNRRINKRHLIDLDIGAQVATRLEDMAKIRQQSVRKIDGAVGKTTKFHPKGNPRLRVP